MILQNGCILPYSYKFSRTPDFENFRTDLISRTPKETILLTFSLLFNDTQSENSLHFSSIGDNT